MILSKVKSLPIPKILASQKGFFKINTHNDKTKYYSAILLKCSCDSIEVNKLNLVSYLRWAC